jgi:hypothetical protein
MIAHFLASMRPRAGPVRSLAEPSRAQRGAGVGSRAAQTPGAPGSVLPFVAFVKFVAVSVFLTV